MRKVRIRDVKGNEIKLRRASGAAQSFVRNEPLAF